jgi:hypothetical protein
MCRAPLQQAFHLQDLDKIKIVPLQLRVTLQLPIDLAVAGESKP